MSSYSTPSMPSPPIPYFVLVDDLFVNASDSACSLPHPHVCAHASASVRIPDAYAPPQYFPETMPSPVLSDVSHASSSLPIRSVYEQRIHDEQLRSCLKLGNLSLDLSALPIQFPRARARKNGELVRYPIINLISLAIRGSPRQALTLHQIYESVEEHLASYRSVPSETAREKEKRIKWQSSVRHSLSLQFMFVRVDRLPGDTDEKLRGNYWTLDPFKFGFSRRSVILEEKKKATAVVAQKKRRPSSPRKKTLAKPRSKAHKSLSPTPQQHRYPPLAPYNGRIAQPHPQKCEPNEFTNYPYLPGSSMARPRDLHDLPPMNIPQIHPIMSSISLHSSQTCDFAVEPYPQYSHYPHHHQQEPYTYSAYHLPSPSMTMERGYAPEQGISPPLFHAPIPVQAPQHHAVPLIIPSHGRSLRSTASRQRRDALIPH